MKLGLFCEHQLPRPWSEGGEHRLFTEALDLIELADRLGIDHVWLAEHHFLEEYSHSSAPEVFLAAASQRTRTIRLGHGVMLMPPRYNHPARAAERIATLDLVSNGRVEFGTGESASRVELEAFGIDRQERHEMWREALEQITDMMVMEPYGGADGRHVSMPCRNVVPKPLQKPHPPLWMACTRRESIRLAARLGLGALSFAFIDPDEAKRWTEEYYTIFRRECSPIGYAVNPNVAMVTPFFCHEDEGVARERAIEGFQFFQFALSYYYGHGTHVPGRSDLWEEFQKVRPALPGRQLGIGTPRQLHDYLLGFAEAGVDQVVLLQPVGKTRHDHLCESLGLFARTVMPELQAQEAERERLKAQVLRPSVEAALARRRERRPLADLEIPAVPAYEAQAFRQAPAVAADGGLRWQAEYIRRIAGEADRQGITPREPAE